MIKIFNKARNLANYYIFNKRGISKYKIVAASILESEYTVVEGAIRKKTDYDDAWILALSKEARIVFDIGCNIGQSAMLICHAGVDEIVLADANPAALARAAENLFLNGWGHKARFYCGFVSNVSDERIKFHTVDTGAAGSMYDAHAKTAKSLESTFDTITISLDSLVEICGVVPDLVKVDVEGAESLVLNGGLNLAKNGMTRFFIEMHSNTELSMHENAFKVLEWCKTTNYEAWYLKEKIKINNPDSISHRGRCHLLLLPSGVEFPKSLLHLEQGSSLEKVF